MIQSLKATIIIEKKKIKIIPNDCQVTTDDLGSKTLASTKGEEIR